jgi:superfamily I DNA and RNA helicase
MEWYSGSYKMKNPFNQASNNMHKLKALLQQKLGTIHFTYGHAVVFPNCKLFGSLPVGVNRDILITLDDMNELNIKIDKIYQKWQQQSFPSLSVTQMNQMRKAIEGEFRLVPVLSNIIAVQEEKLVSLTTEQCRVLDYLVEHKRALIKGVAGSGKTMMAIMQAKRFVDNHGCKNVLFICYNKNLAESLKLAIPNTYKSNIHIYHFHDLCKQYTEKYIKIHFNVPNSEEERGSFWQVDAPSLLITACETHAAPKFDAIVVDEGQDFEAFWWYALEKTRLSADIPYYIFYDPAQNLYVNSEHLPDFGKPIVLQTNCRNTRKIISLCNHLINSEIKSMTTTPDGVINELVKTQNRQETLAKVRQYIKQFMGIDKLDSSQIAILSPYTKNLSSLSGMSSIGDYSLVESYASWKQNDGIYYSTIRSFKGLEADVVIIIDFQYKDWETSDSRNNIHSLNDLYVGISRAKHQLIIITADMDIIQYLERQI